MPRLVSSSLISASVMPALVSVSSRSSLSWPASSGLEKPPDLRPLRAAGLTHTPHQLARRRRAHRNSRRCFSR